MVYFLACNGIYRYKDAIGDIDIDINTNTKDKKDNNEFNNINININNNSNNKANINTSLEEFKYDYENFKEIFYINGLFSLSNPQGYLSSDDFYKIDVKEK